MASRTRSRASEPATTPRPRRRAKRRGFFRRWRLVLLGVPFVGFLGVSAVIAYAYGRLGIPATPPPLQTTQVYDVEGRTIGSFHAAIDRTVIPFSEIPEHLKDAVLAAEDAGFYRHAGIDPISILRAAVVDIRSGSTAQGGSTITQQLVKNVYAGHYENDPDTGERIYVPPSRTVVQKVREALLAVKLEQELSKNQILTRYLNTIYFGHGAYGAQAAAQTYWQKDARKLSILQAATLAAVIQSPSRFDPAVNPADAQVRRNWVLDRMVATDAITAEEAETLKAKPVRTNPIPDGAFASPTLGYFLDFTRRDLMDRYGGSLVYGGGLKITTTLDLDVQDAATAAVQKWLPNLTDPEAAVVAIDPATGAIRAMVGGRDFGVSRVNLATGQGGSGRQAGSAFKPFTLVAAMEAKYSLWSKWNGPATITIPDQTCYTDGKPWTLSNASDEESGIFSLRDATAHSVNTVYAQLVSLVGPSAVVDVAHRLGIRSDLQPYCAITLGSEGVNPLEMTGAYATLAARGIHHDPAGVLAVTDVAGNELESLEPRGEKVLAQNDADLVTFALRSVITGGTGTRAQIGRPAAGKTGTAQDYVDAWFCGYTPQLATCVWVGYPDAERPLQNIGGFGALYGGTIPALIWHDVMSAAMDGVPVVDFVEPSFDGYTLGAELPVPSPSETPSDQPPVEPTSAPSPDPTTSPSPAPSPTVAPSPPASPAPSGPGGGGGPPGGSPTPT
ncbi:MAG: transglycosylase domain-containing protein [Actinomycetota bacterium]